MDLGLKAKVALVAASSKGLGRAVAEELAAEGASLILCARGADTLREVASGLRSRYGVPVHAIAADVSVRGEATRVIEEGRKAVGSIDILVTNSGGPPSGPFEATTPEQWEDATKLLLNSVLEFSRGVLPGMKERRWGRILNITSIAVKQPVEHLILSNSIRAAVTGFARTLANEMATLGITVNNILPGYTLTERVEELAEAVAKRDSISPEEAKARWEMQIPMRRIGDPREFAALAAFLVSERASYITGSSIAVDGGWIRSLL